MDILELETKITFSDEFMPRILKVGQGYKVPLICMEEGQAIEPHRGGAGVFYFVSGQGVMTVEEKDHEVQAGVMVVVEKGEARGIRATGGRLVAFAVHMG